MSLVIDYVRARPGATALLTSVHPGEDESPMGFYRKLGFIDTGVDHIDTERIMRLPSSRDGPGGWNLRRAPAGDRLLQWAASGDEAQRSYRSSSSLWLRWRKAVVKDPFTAVYEARRRLIPDPIWYGLALLVIGIAVADSIPHGPFLALGLCVAAAGAVGGVVGMRRRTQRRPR